MENVLATITDNKIYLAANSFATAAATNAQGLRVKKHPQGQTFTIAGATALGLAAFGMAPVTATVLATAGLFYRFADMAGSAEFIDGNLGRGTEFGNKVGEYVDSLKKSFNKPN